MMKKLLKSKKGQGLVEWIMILALILVAVVTVLGKIGQSAGNKGNEILAELNKSIVKVS